jgi:hypothetical protein
MNARHFRRIALRLKDAVESAHMGHPDFRVQNRIFATLQADMAHGMVKLTPEQQEEFMRAHPRAFSPASGAWGRGGSTIVSLAGVDEETLGEALTLAHQNVTRAASRSKKRTR